jgi:hypothetical protein
MSRPNTRSEHLEDDHVADYFGGDHAMASMFLDVLRSDVASGTALAVCALFADIKTAADCGWWMVGACLASLLGGVRFFLSPISYSLRYRPFTLSPAHPF